jgi:hypothetical protein
MNIFSIYRDEPFYQLEIILSNNFSLLLKWNIFKDKKDNDRPVMRTRYVLFDEQGKRLSLKVLNLKEPVLFKQIEITDTLEDILDGIYHFKDREMLILSYFGKWVNEEFIKMINSGDYAITSIDFKKEGCKII